MNAKSLGTLLLCLLALIAKPALATDEDQPPAADDPAYVSLGDTLVLNLANDSRRLAFLQLKADVLVKDDAARSAVETHVPAIRHQLIVTLSEQPAVEMQTPARRELVRQQVTQQVRDMLQQLADNSSVEEILFSTFLVQ